MLVIGFERVPRVNRDVLIALRGSGNRNPASKARRPGGDDHIFTQDWFRNDDHLREGEVLFAISFFDRLEDLVLHQVEVENVSKPHPEAKTDTRDEDRGRFLLEGELEGQEVLPQHFGQRVEAEEDQVEFLLEEKDREAAARIEPVQREGLGVVERDQRLRGDERRFGVLGDSLGHFFLEALGRVAEGDSPDLQVRDC